MSQSENAPTEQERKAGTSLSRLQWWAFSVPVFLKMVGIVVLVSAMFGLVVYYQVRANISHVHGQMHIQSANRAAVLLASRLERSSQLTDTTLINESIEDILKAFTDVAYVLVLDEEDRIIAHYFGFPTEIIPELPSKADELCSTCHQVPEELDIGSDLLDTSMAPELDESNARKFSRSMGTILEATALIGDGTIGSVRIGHDDSSISREMGAITDALIRSLIICLIVGQGLALMLTYMLVHPILNLVRAANAIGAGDFTWRAKVSSADEIGRLARAFNSMAEDLQTYQAEMQEKEAFRVTLIDRIVQAQEDERVSIARELHDQLGQSLYRVLLSHQDIRQECEIQNPRCDQIEEEIRELIDDVRRLAWDIRPSVLDDFGLDSALQQYVKEMTSRTGLQIDYKCGFAPDAARLPGRIEVILYRIAQEAITNIVRHANAKRASVVLLGHDSEVTLLVEDDGCGFDVSEVFQGGIASLGLMGMKERMVLVGGILTVDSQPNKGAAIRARIPITERI